MASIERKLDKEGTCDTHGEPGEGASTKRIVYGKGTIRYGWNNTPERRLYKKEREDMGRRYTRRENKDGEVTQTERVLH